MIFEKVLVEKLSMFTRRIYFPGIYPFITRMYSFYRSNRQPGIEVEKDYLKMKYNLKISLFSKDLIDHKILFTGVYEKATNVVLEKYIRNGDFIIEAGANSGSETLLISRLTGDTGRVFAFEPVPHVAQKLKYNLKLNNILNVTLFEEALGEKSSTISLNILPLEHPNQGMASKYDYHTGSSTITVKQRTVDELVETVKLIRLDFIKMDVQGAEFDILKGAVKSISRFNPKIFLEASEEHGNLEIIYSYLAEKGYSVHFICSNGKLKALNSGLLKSGNWLAIPKIT